MAVAGLALEIDRNAVSVVALAAPGAVVLGRAVRAGAAVPCLVVLVSWQNLRVAELALVPGWVGADRLRHAVGQRNAPASLDVPLGGFRSRCSHSVGKSRLYFY